MCAALPVVRRIWHFAPGEAIVRQDVLNEWLHIITKGQINLETEDGTVRERLGPGAVIGEEGLFEPGLPSTTARAMTEVETLCLQHSAICWVLLGCPGTISIFAAALRQWGDTIAAGAMDGSTG